MHVIAVLNQKAAGTTVLASDPNGNAAAEVRALAAEITQNLI